jgi:hypothetical protein
MTRHKTEIALAAAIPVRRREVKRARLSFEQIDHFITAQQIEFERGLTTARNGLKLSIL